MRKDKFSLADPQGKYFVRSLYFDTDTFSNYIEKVNGDSDRVKLRIRTYSPVPSANVPIRAELKARKGITVEKHSAWIDIDAYQHFLKTRHWHEVQDPVLSEFERYIHLKTQQPKIIVEYLREGYSNRNEEQIRITFDHKVRSAHAKTLFPGRPFFRYHHPGIIVMEIKCLKVQPIWLRSLVSRYGLRTSTNSKYVQGIEVARKDVVKPAWSY